jgi:hypothetical protein
MGGIGESYADIGALVLVERDATRKPEDVERE